MSKPDTAEQLGGDESTVVSEIVGCGASASVAERKGAAYPCEATDNNRAAPTGNSRNVNGSGSIPVQLPSNVDPSEFQFSTGTTRQKLEF